MRSRTHGVKDLLSMKALQHWPLHLLVCRVHACVPKPDCGPPRHTLAPAEEAWRNGDGSRGVQVDTAVLDRARWELVESAGRRSLGRPYPCPSRVQPAVKASHFEVLAQRRQRRLAFPSPTRTRQSPAHSRTGLYRRGSAPSQSQYYVIRPQFCEKQGSRSGLHQRPLYLAIA